MATLTVSISETLLLNGKDRGSVITKDISSITETFHRIIDVKTTGTQTICEMTTTEGDSEGGKLFSTNCKYLRLANLDTTNFVSITVQNGGTSEYLIKLNPGDSYFLMNPQLDANADGDGSASTAALGDITSILARADTASCQVEIFAALT